MTARCIASACTNAAALPSTGTGTVAFIGTTMIYDPLAASFGLGHPLTPDAPPPRSFALS
ncbi:hypothetical protein AruPA_18765 [Acidiphilium sp. PA]|uniref:hypothetical protein n=1 Tax=Acidiphilium sp. PA TaxID=2871705 RepID=UPI0022445007|nr:hypothetical protein [Acidiphilium sp. PA]MCW8309080.1 hypothetical protein [Acidiphilium sp. PA]